MKTTFRQWLIILALISTATAVSTWGKMETAAARRIAPTSQIPHHTLPPSADTAVAAPTAADAPATVAVAVPPAANADRNGTETSAHNPFPVEREIGQPVPLFAKATPLANVKRFGDREILSATEVELSPSVLKAREFKPGTSLSLSLPGRDRPVTVRLGKVGVDVNGVAVMRGSATTNPKTDMFLLAAENGLAAGTLLMPYAQRSYALVYDRQTQKQLLLEYDLTQSPFPVCGVADAPPADGSGSGAPAVPSASGDGAMEPPDGDEAEDSWRRAVAAAAAEALGLEPDDPNGNPLPVFAARSLANATRVTILLTYDEAAETAILTTQGFPSIGVWAGLLLEQINWVYEQSLVAVAMELAGTQKFAMPAGLASQRDLGTILSQATATGSPNYYLDELTVLRDAYAADLVSVITGVADSGGTAGIAWTPSYLTDPLTEYPLPSAYGYDVVNVVYANPTTIDGLTFSHEVSHNLGAQHSRYQSSNPTSHPYAGGAYWVSPDATRYTGYYAPGSFSANRTSEFACTLLTYPDSIVSDYGTRIGVSAVRLPFVSNPLNSFPAPRPSGTAWHTVPNDLSAADKARYALCDNARRMHHYAPLQAEFRSSVPSYSPRLTLGAAATGTLYGTHRYYYVDLDVDASALAFTLVAGNDSQDYFDLGVNPPAKGYYGRVAADATHRAATAAASETLTLNSPVQGRYWITVESKLASASVGFSLLASTSGTPPKTATPTFDPAGGSFTTGVTVKVAVNCDTPGATIYYTTDGTTPSRTSGLALTPGANFTLPDGAAVTVKAMAVKAGMSDSAVAQANFSRVDPVRLPAPTFSPDGGTFDPEDPPKVTLSCTAAEATILYTLDGTEPDTRAYLGIPMVGSTRIYYTPLALGQTEVQIKAMATTGTANTNSPVATATFTPDYEAGTVPAPIVVPNGGAFPLGATATVKLTSRRAGAALRYTLDGSTPTPSTGLVPPADGVIVLPNEEVRLQAVAYLNSGRSSPLLTSEPFTRYVAAPTISRDGGVLAVGSVVKVTLKSATGGAIIRYTTSGATPSSTVGTVLANGGTVTIPERNGSVVVKAIAYRSGAADSPVFSSKAFTRRIGKPTASVGGGTFLYGATVKVVLKSATPGASIRYTLDGSVPTATQGLFLLNGGSVILPNKAVRLRAVAYEAGYAASEAFLSAVYQRQVAKPSISVNGGVFVAGATVKAVLKSSTAGSVIRYTTDGTAPTSTKGTRVANGATIVVPNKTVRIRALACKTGLTASAVLASNAFTRKVATPAASVNGGRFAKSATVKTVLKTATAGASIRYTLDGTAPSNTKGTALSNGGTVTLPKKTATLRFVAYKAGLSNSTAVTRVFTRY